MNLIVDGMNLIGSRPDGWWRDRPGARRRLVEALAEFSAGRDGTLTVVFDGHPVEGEVEGAAALGVRVRFAPGGPDAADRVIAAMVAELVEPAATTVVTSDGALEAQVRALGAVVMGVGPFRSLLDRAADG